MLSWTASTDDEGVKGYYIYRDGVLIGSEEAELYYKDKGLETGTAYSYTVRAYDLSENLSEESTPLTFTLKTAWLDDNFMNSDAAATTTLPFFVNGKEENATIVNCTVIPDRADYFTQGFTGALRMANESYFTLPEVPNIEKFSFFAASEQADTERTITLQQYNGTTWEDVQTFTVGQGYAASSICEVTSIRSYEPVQLRLYVPNQVVYVRWFKAERYEASNEEYPTPIPTSYSLLTEIFDGGIWGTVDDAAAVTKEVETTILGVTRKYKVNAAKVMPSRGGKTSGSVVATKGAIALPKNISGSLELPALPNVGTVSFIVVNGTSDATKAERGVALQKYENDAWVEVDRLIATPGGADQISIDINQAGLTTLRLVNYGDGSTGDVYLHMLEVVTMAEDPNSIESNERGAVKIYPNPFSQAIHVGNYSDYSSFELCGLSGQLVAKGSVAETIDLSGISAGVYLLQLKKISGEISVHKLIKE